MRFEARVVALGERQVYAEVAIHLLHIQITDIDGRLLAVVDDDERQAVLDREVLAAGIPLRLRSSVVMPRGVLEVRSHACLAALGVPASLPAQSPVGVYR